ncbi:MAG: autotransporter outer membrane beta-barrel domain-containing protein [Desulfovibrio sp.]|nr:autotransporter outer membrane beta-barrel domain-containing protein [Desulfovibrio sp.]
MGPATPFSPAVIRRAASSAGAVSRMLAAGFFTASLALSFVLWAAPACAAGNLTINRNMTITSDAEYNKITGSGSRDLTVTGARVSATDISCATVHLLARNAVIASAQNFRMGPMYVENSTLTAGNIFQSSATGRMVTDNSHIEANIISLGWDYLLNEAAAPPDGPHQHNNSVLTATGSITLYGGLEVVSGDTVVTSTNGNIFARMEDGLTQRDGATLTLRAPNGNITAQNIVAANVLASGVYANSATVQDGSLTLTGAINESAQTNVIADNLTLQNTRASIAALKVGGATSVSGGELTAGELEATRGLTFTDHARAGIESLALQNGTLLAVNSRVAVDRFKDSTGASAVVGNNAALGLGTADPDWIVRQFDAANASSLGPVTAALAVAKPQTLSALPGIVVDGSVMGRPAGVTPGHAIFAPRSLLVVNAAAAASSGAGALSGGSFDVRSGAKLYIPDAVMGATYKVLSGSGAYADATSWNGANLASGTPLLELVRLPQFGMIGTRQVPATSVLPGLDSSLGGVVDGAFAAGTISPGYVNSDSAGIRFLSRATSRDYIGNDPRLSAITIESAARMAALGAVPEMTLAANRAAGNAMGQRTGAEPGGGVRAVGEDGEPVEEALNRHGWALWIMPIFQSTNGFGMTSGNWDLDFSGALGGVAIGCDYTFESALRLGLSLNVGGGYARGSGDLASTTNDMGFWGLGAYAGWQKGNFGLSAEVAYTSAYNSLEQDLPSGMRMRPLKSDMASWALGAGLRAEYRFSTPWLDVTPHIGVRYHHLSTDSYDVKSNGTVLEADPTRQNIWTFPAGFSFSREMELESGWRVRPQLDLSVIPATGDLAARGDVRFTGTGIEAEVKNQIMDYVTWRGALGVELTGGDLAFGLNYSFQVGLKTTAHGVTASFSYQF